MKTMLFACVLALGVPAVVMGQGTKAPAGKDSRAKELYGSMCQACHGPDGNSPLEGMGFVGRKWKSRTVTEAAKTIREGVPGTVMVPFKGRLTEAEIKALAQYVRTLDKKPAKKKKMKREVGVALIGYAFMGKAHSNAYRQVTPFFSPRLTPRLKVICGRTAAHVQAAARTYGWEEASTDWREVVARPDIDLVDVATPGDSHAEIAIAAAKAGKAVLCEKPLANSVAEAQRMLAAVRKAGVVHMICHNYRRAPAVLLAKHLIAEGRIGDVRHFRGTYLQDWIADPKFPMVWRLDKAQAGSGALGDIAAHSIDLARFLVGEITDVCGHLETFIKERPLAGSRRKHGTVTVDDAALALVRFDGGAIGTIEATRMALGRKNHNRFEINGSKGSIAFDLERMNELEVYFETDPAGLRGFRRILVTEADHPFVKAWWPPGHIIGYEHTFTHTFYDLLEAMADSRVPTPNFEDGVRNQKVLAAIEKASQTRKWVRV